MSSIQLKSTEHGGSESREKNKSIETNPKVTNRELVDKNFKTLIMNKDKNIKNTTTIGEPKI